METNDNRLELGKKDQGGLLMQIHKHKVKNASHKERLKKKAAFFDKLTLESLMTFGQYKCSPIELVCRLDPEYIKWAVENGIIMLSLRAAKFLFERLMIRAKEKAREQAQERERVRRSDAEDARAYSNFYANCDCGFDGFYKSDSDNIFRRQRERNARQEQPRQERTQSSSVTNEKLHPAYQYDHLPDRVKYGKILRLEGQVTKDYIKSQYRKLALTFHPDKNTTLDEVMQETARVMFVRVQQAYEYFKREYNL